MQSFSPRRALRGRFLNCSFVHPLGVVSSTLRIILQFQLPENAARFEPSGRPPPACASSVFRKEIDKMMDAVQEIERRLLQRLFRRAGDRESRRDPRHAEEAGAAADALTRAGWERIGVSACTMQDLPAPLVLLLAIVIVLDLASIGFDHEHEDEGTGLRRLAQPKRRCANTVYYS